MYTPKYEKSIISPPVLRHRDKNMVYIIWHPHIKYFRAKIITASKNRESWIQMILSARQVTLFVMKKSRCAENDDNDSKSMMIDAYVAWMRSKSIYQ